MISLERGEFRVNSGLIATVDQNGITLRQLSDSKSFPAHDRVFMTIEEFTALFQTLERHGLSAQEG